MNGYEIISKDGNFFLAKDEMGYFVGRNNSNESYSVVFDFRIK